MMDGKEWGFRILPWRDDGEFNVFMDIGGASFHVFGPSSMAVCEQTVAHFLDVLKSDPKVE